MPEKGRAIAVDEVVLDLEDSVPPRRKDEARARPGRRAPAGRVGRRGRSSVRINGIDTPWFARTSPSSRRGGRGDRLDRRPEGRERRPAPPPRPARREREPPGRTRPIALEALIETAVGTARDRRDRRRRRAPGGADPRPGRPRGFARAARRRSGGARRGAVVRPLDLLVAARAAGIGRSTAPISGSTTSRGLLRSAERARALGYDGKWALHPRQIDAARGDLHPSAAEVERARAVLAALDGDGVGGAVALDGEMVDEASRKRAEGVLARAGRGRTDRAAPSRRYPAAPRCAPSPVTTAASWSSSRTTPASTAARRSASTGRRAS